MTRSAVGWMLTLVCVLGCGGRRVVVPTLADSSSAAYRAANVDVIHRYNGGTSLVTVQLYLLGGTRQLTTQNAGIEALLLQAAAMEQRQGLAETGSQLTMDVTADWTMISLVCLDEDLVTAWAGFAGLFERPAFSEAVLEHARLELVTMARRRFTQPDLRVAAMARQIAFEGHPYRIEPEGTEESLTAITSADLERYWDEEFVSSRMLLVVVGNVQRATVNSLVASSLGTLPRGDYVWTMPPPLPRRSTRYLVEHRTLPTNYLLAYFGGPPPASGDYFGFRVAMAMLSSSLYHTLREDRALSYMVGAPLLDRARPVAGVYITTSRPWIALPSIRRVLSDERSRVAGPYGFDPPGWGEFLDGFAMRQLLERSTSQGQAETLARALLLFGDIAMADQYMDRIRDVSYEDVGYAARRYMRNLQYAYLGDTTLVDGRWFKDNLLANPRVIP